MVNIASVPLAAGCSLIASSGFLTHTYFVIKVIARIMKIKSSWGQYGPAVPFTQALLDTVVEGNFNPPRMERRSLCEFIWNQTDS